MTGDRPVALVTGATRGIGAAIAERLVRRGFDLCISARSAPDLDAMVAHLGSFGDGTVVGIPADLSDESQVSSLAADHERQFARVDLLILNGGMGSIGPLADYPVRHLDRLYQTNLRSAYLLVQHFLPRLREAGQSPRGGKVIAIASSTGLVGEPMNAAYGATKAGLIALCQTLNAEESLRGVTATAICPGYVATAMTESLADQVDGAMLDVADVADATVAMADLSRSCVVPVLAMLRPGPHSWRA